MNRLPKLPISLAALLASWLALSAGASAAEVPDPHAQHHQMMHKMKRATRTTADYTVPAVTLVRDDGKQVSLAAELDDGHPVVLDFLFTTCSTICPLTSQTLAQLQHRLSASAGGELSKVHLASISIDPEQDTPARLAEYAKKLGAGPQWRFYTGTTQASVTAQRAFNAFRGDKMSHTPVTFLRVAPGHPWVRIDGFASADELAAELQTLVAAH